MLRFTIRDVLWLTVVVGLTTGWWLDRERVWRAGERDRQMIGRFKSIGLDLDTLLTELLKSSSRPAPTPVTVVRNVNPKKAKTYLLEPQYVPAHGS